MNNKPLRLSASSIKTFVASKAKWCWQYVLWVYDTIENDSLLVGKLFENYLFTGKDDWSIIEWQPIQDNVKLVESYDNLKYNSWGELLLEGEKQVEVKWELFGIPYIWYIDRIYDWWIEDIKTTQYLSKDDWNKNFWSGMSYWDEYKLQLWLYSRATWITKTRIREYWKFMYKDGRKSKQVIEFIINNDEMEQKYKPIIMEMKELYDKFTTGLIVNTKTV